MQDTNKYLIPTIISVIVIVAIGVGFFAMRRSSTSDLVLTPTVTPNSQNETIVPSPSQVTENGSGVKIVSVEAGSFYYKPNEIRVKKGEKVKIELKSVSMMHDFVIDELNIRVPVTQSGNTGSVEFVVNEVGSYQFYCSVANHKAMGQVGTLIVE